MYGRKMHLANAIGSWVLSLVAKKVAEIIAKRGQFRSSKAFPQPAQFPPSITQSAISLANTTQKQYLNTKIFVTVPPIPFNHSKTNFLKVVI